VIRALRLHLLLALLGALAFAGDAAASRSNPDAAIAALKKAAAERPDDPAYSWAVAEALEAVRRPLQASAQMRAHLVRWPDQPGGWRSLGRVEYRNGHVEPARDALLEALRRDPKDAEASLYLGLALHALGEHEDAERHLEAAAELDPQLAGDALLVAGISHLSRGDDERGRALLDRVVEIAPDSAPAREARVIASRGNRSEDEDSPYELEAYTGAGYDTNVSLEGGSDVPGLGSANGDAFTEFGTRFTWKPPVGEQDPLRLSLVYERGDYMDLNEYSLQRTGGSASWTFAPHDKVAMRLLGSGSFYALDNDPYLLSGQIQPLVAFRLPGHLGAIRLNASAEILDYEESPGLDALERSGVEYGGGVDHVLLSWGEGRKASLLLGGSFSRRQTRGGTDDVLGFRFDNAYDRDLWRATAAARVPLPFAIDAHAELQLDTERYENRNVIDQAFAATAARRRDFVVFSHLALRRNVFRNLDTEMLVSFEDRDSNVAVYRYQHTVAGMRLIATFR
jgi:tetratricopeptide (TPR) repeat protein